MGKKPRHISNFRGLGGILCADGKFIAHDKLFRSGHLAKMKPKDTRKLEERYGIKTIADLRSESEQLEKPDKYRSEQEYVFIPPLDDEQNPSINRHNRKTILKQIIAEEHGARGHMLELYELLVTSPMAIRSYRKLFDILLNEPEGGVLWHCTQGKDRTGVSTAMILLAFGASRDDIMKDYMRTNRAQRLKNYAIFTLVAIAKQNVRYVQALHYVLSARREYMQRVFDVLDDKFGGPIKYLNNQIGLSEMDILKLRETYLVSES